MATTTARVTFTRTKTFSFTVDYPNYSALSDADILTAANLPNGVLGLGELLAGSAPNLGVVSADAWTVANNLDVEEMAYWAPSISFASGDLILPTVPTPFVLTAGAAGTHGATEGIRTAVNATAMVAGRVYEINAVGTTDFTKYGAVRNVTGEKFVCKAVGVGTGTTYLLWNNTGTTVANGVTFTAAAKTASPAAFPLSTAVTLGKTYLANTSQQYRVVTAGTTAAAAPAVGTAVGAFVISGTAVVTRIL